MLIRSVLSYTMLRRGFLAGLVSPGAISVSPSCHLEFSPADFENSTCETFDRRNDELLMPQDCSYVGLAFFLGGLVMNELSLGSDEIEDTVVVGVEASAGSLEIGTFFVADSAAALIVVSSSDSSVGPKIPDPPRGLAGVAIRDLLLFPLGVGSMTSSDGATVFPDLSIAEHAWLIPGNTFAGMELVRGGFNRRERGCLEVSLAITIAFGTTIAPSTVSASAVI